MPLPPGMNFAYWCLSSATLVESSTLSGARLLRNTMVLFVFYRNLGTSLKFFTISYSARTWTSAELSIFFVAYKKISQIWQIYEHMNGGEKDTNKQHIFHMNWKNNTKINQPNEEPLPLNSCYFYMNHSSLIIHVLAQGYGEGGKAWFSLLE